MLNAASLPCHALLLDEVRITAQDVAAHDGFTASLRELNILGMDYCGAVEVSQILSPPPDEDHGLSA